MEIENKIQPSHLSVNKELIIDREEINKIYIKDFQNKIISFCKNMTFLQHKVNFFELSMMDQFQFNECIDFSSEKIKADFKEMEEFYDKCKTSCIAKDPEIEENIEEFVNFKYKLSRPLLNSCVSECVQLYCHLTRNYQEYMVDSKNFY